MFESTKVREIANAHYRTADDRWIQVHRPANDAAWLALYRQVGRDDLLTDERFSTPAEVVSSPGRTLTGAKERARAAVFATLSPFL